MNLPPGRRGERAKRGLHPAAQPVVFVPRPGPGAAVSFAAKRGSHPLERLDRPVSQPD